MPPAYVKPYVMRGETDAADRRSDLRDSNKANDAVCGGEAARLAGGVRLTTSSDRMMWQLKADHGQKQEPAERPNGMT